MGLPPLLFTLSPALTFVNYFKFHFNIGWLKTYKIAENLILPLIYHKRAISRV